MFPYDVIEHVKARILSRQRTVSGRTSRSAVIHLIGLVNVLAVSLRALQKVVWTATVLLDDV